MKNKYSIVIDTLGSDKGPLPIILGASLILKEHEDIDVALVGPETTIKEKLIELGVDFERVEIINADFTVTNYEHPLEAFKTKPDASIFKAMRLLKSDERYIGMLCAGSSGALVMGSAMILPDANRTRPCVAAVLPTSKGTFTALVDTGATIDCEPYQLHQFAKLGSKLMKDAYKIENPRVGLLSNGVEKGKGNKLVKDTYPILEGDETINFVGNIEGNNALCGDCDVLVCDGFAGNQILKSSEGIATQLITEIFKYAKINQSEEAAKIGQYLMGKFDFGSLGGGIVLGTSKLVIKCRGSSDEKAIKNTASILVNLKNNKSIYEGK